MGNLHRLEMLTRRYRYAVNQGLDWADRAGKELDDYLEETEKDVPKEEDQNFSRWHYRNDISMCEIFAGVADDEKKRDKYLEAAEKARNREPTKEEIRWDEIEDKMDSLYEASENERRLFQLNCWVEGYSIHNQREGRCCPDRSCCEVDQTAPLKSRKEYLKLHLQHDKAVSNKLAWIANEYMRRNNPNSI